MSHQFNRLPRIVFNGGFWPKRDNLYPSDVFLDNFESIVTDESGIKFSGKTNFNWQWTEIDSVILEERPSYFGYSLHKYPRRILKIQKSSNVLYINVSSTYPRYSNSSQLIKEIKERVPITKTYKKNYFPGWARVGVAVTTIILIKLYEKN